MKLYLAEYWTGDQTITIGIFRSKLKAENVLTQHAQRALRLRKLEYLISELELDKPYQYQEFKITEYKYKSDLKRVIK